MIVWSNQSRRGLIPAHAGKTWSRRPSRSGRPAHPRSRGENDVRTHKEHHGEGSSPLTRGKRVIVIRLDVRLGLIPAHAGKTTACSPGSSTRRAHPRSRGENGYFSRISSASAGSSPLTRGKHSLTCAFIKRIGQILESLELCASSGSYSLMDAYATDAPQDQARNTGLALPSSRAAS